MAKTRVAILTVSDSVWPLLSVWEQAIPLFQQRGLEVAGLWCFKKRVTKIEGCSPLLWYFRTFGPANFLRLASFAALLKISRLALSLVGKKRRSFAALCRAENVSFHQASAPSDPAVDRWVRDEKIDVVVILIDYIIREPLLSAPRVGMINGHLSLLPANKGPYPYFWAKIKGEQQGVTFHQVSRRIDDGEVLYRKFVRGAGEKTLLRFYLYFLLHYPGMLACAIENLVQDKSPDPLEGVESSYPGWPTRKDYRQFERCGGRLLGLKDLLLALKL